jgi:hypothetical protein
MKVAKMANLDSGNLISSIRWTYLKKIAFERARQGVAVATLLLMVVSRGWAQEIDSSTLQAEAAAKKAQEDTTAKPPQAAPPAQSPVPQTSVPAQTSAPQTSSQQAFPPQSGQPQTQPFFMLPPGTKLPLGLLRPLRLKPGRDIYLQITFPVTVGNQMVIPPGTYVQGVVARIIRKDRRREKLEFEIRSANMIFLNGYTVPIAGTVIIATTNAALQAPPPRNSNGQPASAMAAVGGATTPALPPLPDIGKSARTAMIAIGVAGAVAITAGLVIAANRDPEIEVGTPLEIVLPAPVLLDAERVMAAVQQFNQQAGYAPVQIVQPPVKPAQPRMCYDPGTPSTPDTVIPGHPGTPDTVIPGVNGMPDTVIPGIPETPDRTIPGTGSPGTPGGWHECP